ncbi:MAG: helix-turn-helix domain-containing protein [Sulfuriferula sp.]
MPTKTASNVAGILRPKNPDLVDETEAATILDVSPGTLSVWRSSGRYCVPFLKIGRKVRYSRKALDVWLESRTRSTGATE